MEGGTLQDMTAYFQINQNLSKEIGKKKLKQVL